MAPKKGSLEVWGNQTTMNLNDIVYTNILESRYFKQNLLYVVLMIRAEMALLPHPMLHVLGPVGSLFSCSFASGVVYSLTSSGLFSSSGTLLYVLS